MQEGVYDPGILKAVFLAGGPGSGKSTVANSLFGISFNSFSADGLKPINSDKYFEFLLKTRGISTDLASMSPSQFNKVTVGKDSEREQGKMLATKSYLNYLQGRLGLLIDGTGDNSQKITEHAKELQKSLGYDTYMVFVNTPLEKALERNNNRSRKLPVDVVTSSWNNAQKAMADYKAYFGDKFIEVLNDKDKSPGEPLNIDPAIQKVVDGFIRQPITNPIGKEWIKQSLAARKVNEAETLQSEYKIYCDMDGVLCDFLKQWKKFYKQEAKDAKKLDKQAFDDMLNNAPFEFWATMDWMPGSKQMWDIISKYGVTILSSPADSEASTKGKEAWVQKYMPGTPIIFEKSYNKQKHAEPNAILIDDYKRNVQQWSAAGGLDIQYITAPQVVKKLAELDIT